MPSTTILLQSIGIIYLATVLTPSLSGTNSNLLFGQLLNFMSRKSTSHTTKNIIQDIIQNTYAPFLTARLPSGERPDLTNPLIYNPSTRKLLSNAGTPLPKFDVSREAKLLAENNLGKFYKFVNAKLSNSNGIAPLIDHHGNLLTSDTDKANLFNQYFQSVFTDDNGTLPPFPSRLPPESKETISDIHISRAISYALLTSSN